MTTVLICNLGIRLRRFTCLGGWARFAGSVALHFSMPAHRRRLVVVCSRLVPNAARSSGGSVGELGGDGSAVEPDVLAADLAVAEIPDMQHPEADRAAVAGDAHEGPCDGRVDDVFHDGEVRAKPLPHGNQVLDLEVVDELLIEPQCGGRTGQHAHGRSDNIVLYVVGIDSDRPGGITGQLTAQMVLNQSSHLTDGWHATLLNLRIKRTCSRAEGVSGARLP